MKIEQTFDVTKPLPTVWAFFQDIPEVASCLPGAELLGNTGDGVYAGRVSVKLGAMTATFEGEATIHSNEANHTCRISGRGIDRRGGSRGHVEIEYGLLAEDARTRVTVKADVELSGPAAQFGRQGLLAEMSNRLIGEFVDCLQQKLAASTREEAAAVVAGEVRGIPLLFSSLWRSVVKLLRRTLMRPNKPGNA